MKPTVVLPEESSHLELYDVAFRWGIGADQTDGALSLLEVTIPPRTDTVEEVPAGSWLIKPRNVPHAMWNLAEEPARILEVVMPGGLEGYFKKIAPILREHGPEWTARYDAAAEEYGLEILNDWSSELQAKYGITL